MLSGEQNPTRATKNGWLLIPSIHLKREMLAERGSESKRWSIAKDKGRETYKSNVSFGITVHGRPFHHCAVISSKRVTITLWKIIKKKNTYSYLTRHSFNIHLPRETLESGASEKHYEVRVQLDENRAYHARLLEATQSLKMFILGFLVDECRRKLCLTTLHSRKLLKVPAILTKIYMQILFPHLLSFTFIRM